jgi:hypothetical protein
MSQAESNDSAVLALKTSLDKGSLPKLCFRAKTAESLLSAWVGLLGTLTSVNRLVMQELVLVGHLPNGDPESLDL